MSRPEFVSTRSFQIATKKAFKQMKKKLLFRMIWFPQEKATRAESSSGTDDIIMGPFGSRTKTNNLIEYVIANFFFASVHRKRVAHS